MIENPTEKYGLIMIYDQFGQHVPPNFYDGGEMPMITQFEKAVLDIRDSKVAPYTMIELGSNQAYYSCLFKAILGNENAKSILVEPVDYGMERGKKHFKINGFDGVFLEYSIGPYWGEQGRHFPGRLPHNSFNKESRTVEQIMQECSIDDLDILHCDIDESEWIMLDTSRDVFLGKKINYIFLLTHPTSSDNLHHKCKSFLLNCGYILIAENTENVGGDYMLIFKR
jgi:hypothetical protein